MYYTSCQGSCCCTRPSATMRIYHSVAVHPCSCDNKTLTSPFRLVSHWSHGREQRNKAMMRPSLGSSGRPHMETPHVAVTRPSAVMCSFAVYPSSALNLVDVLNAITTFRGLEHGHAASKMAVGQLSGLGSGSPPPSGEAPGT